MWCVVLAALISSALLVVPANASPARSQHLERLASLEQEILTKVNDVRAAHGLRSLKISSELESAAVDHSQSMLTYGYFAHEARDGSSFRARLTRFYPLDGFTSWRAGENLVYSSARLNASGAVRAWMRSPALREDLLAPRWRETGVGAVHADSAGGTFKHQPVWLVTMDFGLRTRR